MTWIAFRTFLKHIPWQAWAAIGLALALLLGIRWHNHAVSDAYRSGVKDERARIERQIQADKIAQAQRERVATDNLRHQEAKDQAAADQRRQEIDNATSNLPDNAPSARQRARVCIELRREAKAHGRPQPAC